MKKILALAICACISMGACSNVSAGYGSATPAHASKNKAHATSKASKRGQKINYVLTAAKRTQKARSAHIGLELTMNVAGRTIVLHGQGAFDLQRNLGKMQVYTSAPGGAPAMHLTELIHGYDLYMHSPQLSQLPGNKPWLFVDMKALAAGQGMSLPQLSQMNNNPAEALSTLRAVSSKIVNVGKETVNGVETTHYRARINVDRAARHELKGSQMLAPSIRAMLPRALPVEVWVDGKGLVRREALNMTMSPPGEQTMTLRMQFELSGFGTPVHVSIPPRSQTQNFLDVAARAYGGTSPS